MSVLIAGCGYVGYRVARKLLAAGDEVFAITRDPEKAKRLQSDGLRPIIADLGAPKAALPSLPDVDSVVWSVGYQRIAGQDRNTIWIDGLRRLLGALASPGSNTDRPRRVVYTSSTGVYGDGGGADVDEYTSALPVTEGGRACLEAESILQQEAARGRFQAIILRLAGIYGPDRLLRRVSELRSATPIASPPDDWLNLIHVEDASAMIQHVLTSPGIPTHLSNGSMIINVVASESVTRRDYYEQLAALVDAPAPVFQTGTPSQPVADGRSRGRSGNRRVVSAVRSQLNVHFQFDNLRAGLANAVTQSRQDVEGL